MAGRLVSFSQQSPRTKPEELERNRQVTLSNIHDLIKGRYLSSVTESVRNSKTPEELRIAKYSLPHFIVGGTAEIGHALEDLKPNGYVQLDYDFKHLSGDERALRYMCAGFKIALSELPFIALAFISPSGKGVKAIACTDLKDKSDYREYLIKTLSIVDSAIQQVYGLTGKISGYADILGINQVCYLCRDEYVHFNPEPLELKVFKDSPKVVEKIVVESSDDPYIRRRIEGIFKRMAHNISTAPKGSKWQARKDNSTGAGGYVAAGYISKEEALAILTEAAISNSNKPRQASNTVRDCLEIGINKGPIYLD